MGCEPGNDSGSASTRSLVMMGVLKSKALCMSKALHPKVLCNQSNDWLGSESSWRTIILGDDWPEPS